MEYARFRVFLPPPPIPLTRADSEKEERFEPKVVERWGEIVCRNVDGSITVELGGRFDLYCPPEERGKLKTLAPGEWNLA